MKRWMVVVLAALVVCAIGCSGGGNSPMAPTEGPVKESSTGPAHQMLGYYHFIADPDAGTLDFVQMREVSMHLNALPFLEPPVLLNLTLESLQFNGNIIEADIGLRHPFLGLHEFSGFDVAGVLISNGSIGGFADPEILMPGDSDLHLDNPDGYIRWWNPSEFPHNAGMFSYIDGLLGAPDSIGNYTATINGYKYFCDDFTGSDDDMSLVDPTGRGLFSAGQKNVRHYTIDMGPGLEFNYAIDANWQFPNGDPPWAAPDDFGPEANRAEAWNMSYGEIENSLWNDGSDNGGGLNLAIDVYDWFNADQNVVTIESPGNFDATSSSTAVGGGVGYSTYEVEIIDATPGMTSIDLFITIECEAVGYGGLLPGKTQAVYFTGSVSVGSEPPITTDDLPEWSCFQYNAANVGRNSFDQGFDHQNYLQSWSVPISGSIKNPGPAITETHVYFTANSSFYSNTGHRIYCLDATNGNTVWTNQINLSGDYGRAMTGAVWFDDGADGRIVVGGDRVWCFDALTGATEWEYGSSYLCVRPNAKVYNSRVYIALGGAMHCIDAMTGAQVWQSDPLICGSETVPAIADDKVYFARGTTFYCLDADTGAILWQTSGVQGQSHWDGPLVINGRVYMASYSQWLGCLDADTGELYWTFTEATSSAWITGLTYWIDPSDDRVVVYLGGAFSTGACRAVKDMGAYGSKIWQSSSHYFDGSPVYNDGVVYVGDTSGSLFGYDAATGSQVFSHPISGGTRAGVGFAFGRLIVVGGSNIFCLE